MSKSTIVVRIILGLALGVAVVYAFSIYSFNRSMKKAIGPEFQKDMLDLGSAVKGNLGKALFEHGTLVPNDANLPVGSNAIEQGKRLLADYRNDPAKFKKYSDMLDTALNAPAVGDALRQTPASAKPPSNSLDVASVRIDQRVDAWGHPYCLSAYGDRLAIVSLGPEAGTLACQNPKVSKKEILSAQRKLYEGPSGEVILIVDRSSPKRSIEQAAESLASRP